MNIEELRNYCLAKIGVTEEMPFGPETLVFKIGGKVFLLVGIDGKPLQFNVKCDPEKAIALREEFTCVKPGYHMNKKHWNTIVLDGSVELKKVHEWIDDSYFLVAKGLTKAEHRKLFK